MKYITLTKENIATEHICCAISDKKCIESSELKKQWLKKEFENGFIFKRIDDRAKVFIEYGPAGFSFLYLTFNKEAPVPKFNELSKTSECPEKNGHTIKNNERCSIGTKPCNYFFIILQR